MRVLVTGGAGFIGSHVVDKCLEAGHYVAVIDDLSTGKMENLREGIPFYRVDVADAGAVNEVFAHVKPATVIHMAAQISVSRSVKDPAADARVNILGLLNVLEASVRHRVESFVFASSGGVLYGDVYEPVPEGAPLSPVSPYGISKLAGENYLRFFSGEHGIRCVALRYGNVYGPRQDPFGEAGVVAIFIHRLLSGCEPVINGDGKYVRDYVFVDDVARANLLALNGKNPGFRAYNIGTGKGTDVNELESGIRTALQEVLRRDGVQIDLPAPRHGAPRPGDLRSSILDSTRARAELGWTASVPLEEGLRRTVTWFVNHNKSQPGPERTFAETALSRGRDGFSRWRRFE